MKWKIPKGLFDILPFNEDQSWRLSDRWQYVENVIRKTANDFGYKEIRTPIFERTELFLKGVGETTDIVTKEMYTFKDKKGRSMTLRPEGTASVMRAFIEKNLHTFGKTQKFYYLGPMFRYERPQAGRYRQHHQFGVEAIGNPSYEQDAEVIDLLLETYRRLNIKNLHVMINSLGDEGSRNQFKNNLKKYLTPYFDKLSAESQVRFHKNPLRILDSKAKEDQAILKNAPSILDYLSPDSKRHFDLLTALLTKMNISYTINPLLVRGFDYYTKTVFEIVSGELGAQNAVGGGGRYDHLLASYQGPDLPGVGFGTGLERILQTMEEQKIAFPDLLAPFAYAVALDPSQKEETMLFATELRHHFIPTEIDLHLSKLKKSIQTALQKKAKFLLVFGEEEKSKGIIKIKDLKSREEFDISKENALTFLSEKYKKLSKDLYEL